MEKECARDVPSVRALYRALLCEWYAIIFTLWIIVSLSVFLGGLTVLAPHSQFLRQTFHHAANRNVPAGPVVIGFMASSIITVFLMAVLGYLGVVIFSIKIRVRRRRRSS